MINDTNLREVARGLHVLRLRVLLHPQATRSGRTPLARQLAEERYKAAREVVSRLGLGPTEMAVYMDVLAAAEAVGPDWQGRLGAFVDSQWLEAAADNLMHTWKGE